VAELIGIDSNILLYVEGVGDDEKRIVATDILAELDYDKVVLANQVLGEMYWVLIRKSKISRSLARDRIAMWQKAAKSLPTTHAAFQTALDLATDHNFQIWDALILAVFAENGCTCLLSEDMQDGFTWRGVEIINPINPSGVARLKKLGFIG
jgi:predicted nucleic acid-binding protein